MLQTKAHEIQPHWVIWGEKRRSTKQRNECYCKGISIWYNGICVSVTICSNGRHWKSRKKGKIVAQSGQPAHAIRGFRNDPDAS